MRGFRSFEPVGLTVSWLKHHVPIMSPRREGALVPTIACRVYKSTRRDELYVYLRRESTLDEIPEALQRLTGRLEFVMDLDLHQGLKLARSDVDAVMASLREQGYYLQMPPVQVKGLHS